ncbi:MAG: ATP-dependent DNA helicase RecG [Candidatus Krumholzibacteriota bacterium]|nr:ATP-dependent DNA helicase RecG [Candidatus Krumholzibacteriota bacterium]
MEKEIFDKNILSGSSQYVKGVGPARQVLLSRLGIETVEDLLSHYPRDYYDRSELKKINNLEEGRRTGFTGTVLAVSNRRLGPRRSLLTVAAGDETGIINLVFFNQPYLEKQFRQGLQIVASGTPQSYRGQKQIVAPEYEIIAGELGDDLIHTGRIVPVYPLTAGISQRMIRRIIRSAIEKSEGMIAENLPERLMKSMHLPGRAEGIRQIHYPDDWKSLERTVRRFKFEEVFFLHLLIHQRRKLFTGGRPRPTLVRPFRLVDAFIDSLPFHLTEAQKRVLSEIENDITGKRGLGRLLQGDVGSGKTIVGIVAMLMAVSSGYQAAMMVPTEILAEQHAQKIREYLKDLSVNVELLIGSMRPSEKMAINERLADGSIDIVIGTQTLIQDGISFRDLGLAVIDEQHRFGVKQRARLGKGDTIPHFLVMTATPIPRSLAQTVYGDLDLSIIDELPLGRRRVRTEIVEYGGREKVFQRIREIFDSGKQAFILYPLVEENEKSDLKAAVDEYERLQKGEFAGYSIGLLHGRMSFEEKSKAIEMFREGKISGLVTTTVIEVGVDIPNATALLVNHPERFGLAQLHQLRGRVGRGGDEGECYLVPGDNAGSGSSRRLVFFAGNDDGFKVAEMDLKMRGPGEIWGLRQSGYPTFRLINPLSDKELVERSWSESLAILQEDPHLEKKENEVVSSYYHGYYKKKMEIADIG